MHTLWAIRERETGRRPPSLPGAMSTNTHLLHRLKLDKLLDEHDGCVNTVHFTPSGDLLLSGSDDLQIIIWDWATGGSGLLVGWGLCMMTHSPMCIIRTYLYHTHVSGHPRLKFIPGHRNNIFQAKVLPQTNNKTIVSCAADGQVSHTCGIHLSTVVLRLRHRFNCLTFEHSYSMNLKPDHVMCLSRSAFLIWARPEPSQRGS